MRPLSELIDDEDSAQPLLDEWIQNTKVTVAVAPVDRSLGDAALLATQVTTRSPMGAIVHRYAGIELDRRWLRVLGAGGHASFPRSLPEWNKGRADGFLLVADDVVGGSFAINGGTLGADAGKLYYFAPDTLRWEPLKMGYSEFLQWAMSGAMEEFYADHRWHGWKKEVATIRSDQMFSIYPPLWAAGPKVGKRSRRPIPAEEQFAVQMDFAKQLG